MAAMAAKHSEPIKRTDIIELIIRSDFSGFVACVTEEPNSVNSVQSVSGMNAAMLCVYGGLPTYFQYIANNAGGWLDLSHKDKRNRDLLTIALGTMNSELIDKVQAYYEENAPAFINNWPEP